MKETSTFSDIAVKVLKSGADSLVEGLKAGSGVDQSLLMKSGARRIDKDLRSTGSPGLSNTGQKELPDEAASFGMVVSLFNRHEAVMKSLKPAPGVTRLNSGTIT